MRRMTAMAVLAALCAPQAAVAQAARLQLAPAGNWVADFAEDSCALRRSFSDGTTTVFLELRQELPEGAVQMILGSEDLSPSRRDPRTAFEPSGSLLTHITYEAFQNDNGFKGLIITETLLDQTARELTKAEGGRRPWPAADRDRRMHEIVGYLVSDAFNKDFVLLTGSLQAPMKVMQTCLDDLMAQWGLDPAVQRTLTRTVDTDYNRDWMRGIVQAQVPLTRANGSIRARILVDAAGKATACKVLSPSGSEDRAAEFCRQLTRRAQFEPALDATGRPVPSYFMWQTTAIRRSQTVIMR